MTINSTKLKQRRTCRINVFVITQVTSAEIYLLNSTILNTELLRRKTSNQSSLKKTQLPVVKTPQNSIMEANQLQRIASKRNILFCGTLDCSVTSCYIGCCCNFFAQDTEGCSSVNGFGCMRSCRKTAPRVKMQND